RRDGAEEAPVEEVERWTDGDHVAQLRRLRRKAERDPCPEGVADEDERGPGRKLSAERGQCRAGVVDLGRPAAEAASAPPGTTEVEAQGSDAPGHERARHRDDDGVVHAATVLGVGGAEGGAGGGGGQGYRETRL